MNIRNVLPSAFAAIALTCCFTVQQALATVSVTVQPQNPVVFASSNVTFLAQKTITGGETVTGYVWRVSSNNLPPFVIIPTATNAIFPITNVQLSDAGYYFVTVIYNSGANTGLQAVSAASQLTVIDIAHITSQPTPTNSIRITGSNILLSATAAGTLPLTYHWRQNGGNLSDSGRVTGSSTNALSITGLITNDTGNYDLVVSNLYGSATSQVAVLNVYAPPFVAVAPTDLIVIVSNNAVFSLTPGGSPPFSFQWQKGANILTNGGRISGATSSTLTISSALTNDNGSYSVTFTNPVGSATTAPVTLTVLIPPVITSATNALGQQGFGLNYTATATGSLPITFGADGLPAGLSILTNGVITGIPSVSGVFNVTLYATNPATVAATNLQIVLITDVPGITSSLTINGQQGRNLNYRITASNNPTSFSASGLPPGINLNPLTGVISGPSIVSGTFPITIGAANQYGADSKAATLILASDIPVITSPLTASGLENSTNFTYTIRASNSPTYFNVIGLPLGLSVNTNTGVISGTLFEGGTNQVLIEAGNAYGVGSNVLTLNIAYATIIKPAITGVTCTFSPPYLLDFSFSLMDGSNAIARPPDQLLVQCFEGDVQDTNNPTMDPIPTETAFIVNRAISANSSAKQLKTMFALDYSYSMFISPGAITNMQAAVENLIGEEPPTAQFGVVEFNADYVAPMVVTNSSGAVFTSDKKALATAIDGIQSNYVQGNYAGTRFYDALTNALSQFAAKSTVEDRYLIVMSDGNDDSSLFLSPTNTSTRADLIVKMALAAGVKIYCVGFGPNANTNVLLQLSSQTLGQYYAAATGADLGTQFALLLKSLNSQYLLRWATLQRTGFGFQPMFTVTVGGQQAGFNTAFNFIPYLTNFDTNMPPNIINILYTNVNVPPASNYVATSYAGDVKLGSLSLVPDVLSNASRVTLHAFYVPRFVREFQIDYRANYPCIPTLLSAGPGEILNGWTVTQTNDGTGGQLLTMASPNPTDPATSLPYGIMGDLLSFQFESQALPTPQQAFAYFNILTNIYATLPPGGQNFTLTNTSLFVTNFPPTPPFGTPVPWLQMYFPGNTNYAALELTNVNGNGLPVWQDYVAGLNPTNASSVFFVHSLVSPKPGVAPIITFPTALGRIYRVDTSTTPGVWMTLLDQIAGTGGDVSISDNRNLSGVGSVYYRVSVSYSFGSP